MACQKQVSPPSSIGLPSLSAYGPVTDVDLPTLILYVEFTPAQQASYDAKR
ncbi:hypothetical protein SAMN04487981_10927 [Streptomyces sp. cf386]|nr:hypothetical protein SAMN04487981_10927 [Streptomyces sp. cf386]